MQMIIEGRQQIGRLSLRVEPDNPKAETVWVIFRDDRQIYLRLDITDLWRSNSGLTAAFCANAAVDVGRAILAAKTQVFSSMQRDFAGRTERAIAALNGVQETDEDDPGAEARQPSLLDTEGKYDDGLC